MKIITKYKLFKLLKISPVSKQGSCRLCNGFEFSHSPDCPVVAWYFDTPEFKQARFDSKKELDQRFLNVGFKCAQRNGKV